MSGSRESQARSRVAGFSARRPAVEGAMADERYSQLGHNSWVQIGHGSYATVLPSWDTQEQRLVAVKIQRRTSDTAVREMMFFQTLPRHPHVSRILHAFVIEEDLKLVFEYCQSSLHDWYKRSQGFMNWEVTLRCGFQVLQGLAHLHQNDLAHRD